MADRYFPNEMPTYVEDATVEAVCGKNEDSLGALLSLPYDYLNTRLNKAASDIKDSVVRKTWPIKARRVSDPTLYTGLLGSAFLLFKSFHATKNMDDLSLCSEIIAACDTVKDSRYMTFICGWPGVCSLGAVCAKLIGDQDLLNYYVGKFDKIHLPHELPHELLYGRAGLLWACLFLKKNGIAIPSVDTRQIADYMIQAGRNLSKGGSCPLMYEWHGKRYWGAAHGLAGIMHVLMHMELNSDDMNAVRGVLLYMVKNRFPSGNYPSSEENGTDRLVHWCHGAPGVALTLVKAAQVFGDNEFTRAAEGAGEVVWRRGLLKRVGICHGISGNAYVFLSLYRLTGKKEYLYKAKAFTCFLLDRATNLIAKGEMHAGDHPDSLFEGVAGMAHLFFDMMEPSLARFPAYEL